MTRWAVGIAALVASGVLHAAGMLALSRPDAVQMQGGATGEAALLGDAFADLAAGAVPVVASPQPSATADMQQAVAVPETPPVTPAATPPLSPTGAVDTAAPPRMVAPSQPALPQAAVTPDLSAPQSPYPTEPATTEGVASVVAAVTPPVAPTATVRPEARPSLPAAAQTLSARPDAPPATRPPAAAARPAGNAGVNARKGSAAGSDTASAIGAAGARVAAGPPGNAAADNFPGQVLRQIHAARKPRAPARGTVVVAFSIAPSGALAGASVERSSGSPALDRVALDHIRRAAPFPAPP
ncbi:MAG: TonB family protein, partial [Gemmobacter sp.]